MMRRWLSLSIAALAAVTALGQVTTDDFDLPLENARIRAQRVAYITERLSLTPQESERFWPLYNEMEEEKSRILLRYDTGRPSDRMTDAEAERLIDNTFRRDEELLNLRRRYYERFRQVIPARKIALFPRAEREFKRELLEELRRRREQQGGGMPPRRG